MPIKTIKPSPYTSLALSPITGHMLQNFHRMINYLSPVDDKNGHGLRWLEAQFTFTDLEGNRHVMRSYGWFAFARKAQWQDDKRRNRKNQITPLYIDYLLVQSIYNRERGITKRNVNRDRAVQLLTQAVTLLRKA